MTAEAKIRISTEGAQALSILKNMRQEFAAIGKDGAKAADAVEANWSKAVGEVSAGLNKVNSLKQELASAGSGSFAGQAAEAGRFTDQLNSARSAAVQLFATLAGANAIRQAVELSDTYASMSARLRIATRDEETYRQAMSASADLSGRYQQNLAATTNSFGKAYAAIKPLGGTVQQTTVLIEAMLSALKSGGATTEEAASTVLQFSQALGKGVLNGDEFNSINEAAPGLLRALAEGLKVPISALKEMGAQGQLSTAKIVEGLSAALPKLQADAAGIPATVGGAVQGVKNELLTYIGTSETAKVATRALIGDINAIGGGIGPIVSAVASLAAVIGASYVGRMVAAGVATASLTFQQARLSAAASSVAVELGIAGAAAGRYASLTATGSVAMNLAATGASRLLGLFGGPIGLVVTLGTLAASWIALGKAKKDAETRDDVAKERAAVEGQVKAIQDRMRRGGVNILDAKADLDAAKRQLADLDVLLAKHDADAAQKLKDGLKTKNEVERDYQEKRRLLIVDSEARISALSAKDRATQTAAIKADLKERLALLDAQRGAGAASGPQLQDPASIAAIEKEFKTRESVTKEFDAKRAAYVLAKDAEINQARATGTMAQVQALEAQKDNVLKRLEKDRQKALQDLDKDGEVTRLAQAKDTFDKVAVLHADALQRQAQQAQQAYEDGLISYQAYLQARSAAEDQALAAEATALKKQLSAQEKAVAENRAIRAKATTANERASADDAIQRGLDSIAKLEADIEKKKRDQLTATQQRRREEQQILIDLRRQREEIDAMLTKATGTETPDTIARSVRRQYEPQLQKVMQNNEDPGPLLKLIDVDVERAKFELLLRQFQERRDELNLAEQSVQSQRDAGLINDAQAEQRILELRQQSLQALRDQAAALADQSRKLDEVAGKSQPKEAGQVKSADIDVTKVGDLRSEMEKTARSTGMNAISTELSNILSGSKKASEGLRDMVGNFAKSMLDLISKRLGEQLVNSLFGAGGAPGAAGGGGWAQAAATFAASFFHGGGVVSVGGGTRALPASTWALAPRYHTGGIAGLAPNEVPAILQAGEEVLTANDPRHSRNSSRTVGGVTVTNQVNISGAQGGEKDQADAASDLTAMINSAIDAWAVRQARPGGILSGS